MGHQLNPLEKEFLIRQYKANPDVGLKQAKKNYTVRRNSNGELVYLRLKPKNSVL